MERRRRAKKNRRGVGRGLICCWGFDVVWLFHVHWGRFCGGVDRGLFIRDKGLEGQDLQQPKVGQEHGQQVQEGSNNHADPVADLPGVKNRVHSMNSFIFF